MLKCFVLEWRIERKWLDYGARYGDYVASGWHVYIGKHYGNSTMTIGQDPNAWANFEQFVAANVAQ